MKKRIKNILSHHRVLNSSPNKRNLARTKLKAFADDMFNVARLMIFVFDRVENIVGKGENADLSAFSPFPIMFSKALYFRFAITRLCLV